MFRAESQANAGFGNDTPCDFRSGGSPARHSDRRRQLGGRRERQDDQPSGTGGRCGRPVQGGANAGHTIINEYGKFALHILPSGVFYPHIVNVIGPAVALDLESLFAELDDLEARGVPTLNVRVSDRAQILLPIHKQFDALEEERLGDRAFGSTKSGIAPFYSDKALKVGVDEIFDEGKLADRLGPIQALRNRVLQSVYGEPPVSASELVYHCVAYRDRLEP
tara:strand:+ start:4441 stop:5106 length:666 start_codon:yes stop_codon:yes gene_type:complete